jgi:hypothetical protein
MTESIYHVWVTYAIEGDSLVLKVGDECSFQLGVRSVLQVKIERFNDDRARSAFGGGVVVGYVNLRIAAASEAFKDVVPVIESALLEFEFRH